MIRRRRAWLALLALVLVAALVLIGLGLGGGGGASHLTTNNVDAPFGPFAGYVTVGAVTSVGASIRVPRIVRGSPLGEAATWIGVQGYGPPDRFLQIGVLEIRVQGRAWDRPANGYFAFWSDTRHSFRPAVLFAVKPYDTLRASMSRAHGHWRLAISDATSGARRSFSTSQEMDGPFEQAEWMQEDPGAEAHHVSYPRLTPPELNALAPPEFENMTADNAPVPSSRLYSQWMSVNHENLAPTPPRDDAFTLVRAPAVTAVGALYMRASASASTAFVQFEDERKGWNAQTPRRLIAAASARFTTAMLSGRQALRMATWPARALVLLPAEDRQAAALIADAQPPAHLTSATFAAWNAKLTQAIVQGGPAGAAFRTALGLPAFGAAYRR